MTMTLVKLSYNSKLVSDPGLVLQTPLCMVWLSIDNSMSKTLDYVMDFNEKRHFWVSVTKCFLTLELH